MDLRARCLAKNETGYWMLVFERSELNLYVYYGSSGATHAGGLDHVTIDDFFTLTPKDDLQAVARNALADLIFDAVGLPDVDFPM